MTRRRDLELPHRGPRPAGQDAKPCQCRVPLLDRHPDHGLWRCAKCGRAHDPKRKARP